MSKSNPIPVRFSKEELEAINDLSAETGLSKTDIIQRAIRMFFSEAAKRDNYGWILDELGPKTLGSERRRQGSRKHGLLFEESKEYGKPAAPTKKSS